MQKQPQKQIQIEFDENSAEGIYSNLVLTGNTPSEFILDFARMLPGLAKAKVFSRIIMTPQSAKSLLEVLGRTVAQYEKIFGEIKVQRGKENPAIGFQSGNPLPGDKKTN